MNTQQLLERIQQLTRHTHENYAPLQGKAKIVLSVPPQDFPITLHIEGVEVPVSLATPCFEIPLERIELRLPEGEDLPWDYFQAPGMYDQNLARCYKCDALIAPSLKAGFLQPFYGTLMDHLQEKHPEVLQYTIVLHGARP